MFRTFAVTGWATLFMALQASSPARAAEHEPEAQNLENHPGRHHAEHPNVLGVRVGFLSRLEPEDRQLTYEPGAFFGLSYERTLIHEWLEFEVSAPVAVLFGEQTGLALPIDVHLKKPFHPVGWASPYLAVGPTFDVNLRPERAVYFGASFAAGTYLWPTPRIGVDIEFDYNIVAEDGRAVHELLLATGPVFRF